MQAGSITFSTALDNEQLEKDLQSLTKKIEKKEREIAELTAKRDQAKDQSLFDSDTLDREKAKLQEIKDQLTDLRNMSKDKSYDLETREGYAAQIPAVKQEYEDQKTRVNALQREWDKLESSVDRYTAQITEAEAELQRQKEEAGYITQKLEEASRGEGKVVAFLSRVDEKLSSVIDKLRQQQAVSAEVNKALGDVVSTQTKLTGLAEEFSLGAKIGLAGLAQTAIQMTSSIAKGVPNVLKAASSRVAGFAKNTLGKIPSLAKAAFSKASQFASKFGKELFGIVKNMNIFSKLSVSLGRTFKRLGSTIKQAFVFSVICQGLSLIRQQMGSYLMVNAQFSTALRQLQGVLLTAFQPIYDAVVPALTTLMNVLSRVIATITQFTAALFGTTAKQAQKNAEALHKEANALKETGSAAEDAAGSLAGFDEINTIQTEQQGGGGGGASQEVGPSFDYEYAETAFDSWGEAFDAFLDNLINNGIPRLESAFSSFADWLNDLSKKLYDMFTFPGVLEKVQQLGRDLANAFNDLVNSINWYQLGQALGAGLNLALQFLVEFIYNFDWMNLGTKLAEFINGAVSEIDWYAVGMLLWAGFKIAIETLVGFLLGLDMVALADAASNLVMGFFDEMKSTIQRMPWAQIGDQIATFLNNIDWYGTLTSAIQAIQAALRALQQTVAGFVRTLKWSEIAEEIYTAINDSLGNINWRQIGQTLGELFIHVVDFLRDLIAGIDWYQIGTDIKDLLVGIDWSSVAESVFSALGAAFGAATEFLWGLISDAWRSVVDWWHDSAYEDGKFTLLGLLDGIISVIVDIGTWIKDHIFKPFIDGFKNVFGIHSPSTVMAEQGKYLVDGLLQGISNTWSSIVEFFSEKVEGIKKTLSDAWSTIKENASSIFSGIKENIIEIWSNLKEKTASTWSNIKTDLSTKWSSIKSSADSKWSEIKTSLINTWQEISTNAGSKFSEIKESIINKMNELKDNDWASIGKSVVDGIVSGLQSIWNTLTGWVRDVKNAIEDAFSGASKSRGGGFGTSGSGSFGGGRMSMRSFPDISNFNIPALAQGAVIPPNREFLAVLGDQRSGTNIEAPLETIKQALAEVMQSQSGGEIVVNITTTLDGRVLARNQVRHINDMTRQSGKPVLLF